MRTARKRHTPEFKSKVALEALQGLRPLQQIAKNYQVHPTQVSQWKRELKERLPEIIATKSDGREEDWEKDRDRLHAKIGQLTVELDWLKKKSAKLDL